MLGWESPLTKNEYGHIIGDRLLSAERNANGERLIQFCEAADLFLVNTFFAGRDTGTWKCVTSRRELNITLDHIAMPRALMYLVEECEVDSYFSDSESNHRLTVCSLQRNGDRRDLQTQQRNTTRMEEPWWQSLHGNLEVQQAFTTTMQNTTRMAGPWWQSLQGNSVLGIVRFTSCSHAVGSHTVLGSRGQTDCA